MTAADLALHNVDILHEIFAYLTGAPDGKSNGLTRSNPEYLRTLANAAQSCKTFSSPALDALWWKLDNIAHLFLLLPAIYRFEHSYVLDGVVETHDWLRFDAYARRVRCLIYIDDENFDPSIFLRIAQLRNNTPLLPFLVSLRTMPSFGPGLLPLISPTLRHISFFPHNSHDIYPVVWTCLDALADTASDLNFLSVQTTLSKASLFSISRMSNLHTLLLYCMGIKDLGIIRALSAFQHLVRLEIFFDSAASSITQFDPSMYQPPTTPFPKLESLRLDLPPKHLSSVLMQLKSDGLESLEVSASTPSLEHAADAVHWGQSFKTIQRKFRNSLRKLKLHYHPPSRDAEDGIPLNLFHIFRPLLGLNGLETVAILNFPWSAFSDEEYYELTTAWKGIKELVFLRRNVVDQLPNATFHTLQTFAKNCPHLRVLAITLNTSPLPPLDGVEVLSHSLQILRLENTAIDDAFNVARYLDRIFPSLAQVQSSVALVDTFRKGLKAAREDEITRQSQP